MDRIASIILALCLAAGVACGAVSKEAPVDQSWDSVSSVSITGYSVTCAGGSPLITASVMSEFEEFNVTGVTYNSLAFTQKTELVINGSVSQEGIVETWYRVGTTGSAQTLTASFSSGDWVGHVAAQAFCGVDQTTPLGTSVTLEGEVGALSLSVTVPASGMAMSAAFSNNGASAPSLDPQSGATEEWEALGCCSSAAGGTRTTTGDCGVTWDGSGRPSGLICTPINATAVAASTTFFERRR